MQDALQNESQQIPDQMEGQVPEGMEQFMQDGQGQEMMEQQGEQIPPGMEEYMAQQGGQEMSPEMMQQQGGQQMAYGGKVNKFNHGGLHTELRQPQTALIGNVQGITPMQGSVVDPTLTPTAGTPEVSGAGAGIGAGAVVGAASTALDLGKTAFGPTGIDTTGATAAPEVQSGAMGAATGALKGAAAGASFGPWGAAIGGVVGGAAGLIGAGKAKRDADKARHQYVFAQNSKLRQSDFAYGGKVLPDYSINQPVTSTKSFGEAYNPFGQSQIRPGIDSDSLPSASNFLSNQLAITSNNNKPIVSTTPSTYDTTILENTKRKTMAGRALDFIGDKDSRGAEFAPVVSNLLALKNLKRGATARGSRLDNVYQKQQFDEARALNQLGQQNIPRALTEASGGDAGALRSSLLGADVNYKKALSNVMGDQAQRNIAENQFKYQADAQKDQTNVMLDQDFINRQAQDEGAYQSTKSKFQRQIADDIAGIGREAGNKDLVKEMFGYKWDGEYYVDKNGIKHSREEVNKKVAEKKAEKIKTTTTQNMFGGYTMKKR
jgi:hypothetical protein